MMKPSRFVTSWKRDGEMVWSDPKHQGNGLLCEERDGGENCAENGEETLAADLGPIFIDK